MKSEYIVVNGNESFPLHNYELSRNIRTGSKIYRDDFFLGVISKEAVEIICYRMVSYAINNFASEKMYHEEECMRLCGDYINGSLPRYEYKLKELEQKILTNIKSSSEEPRESYSISYAVLGVSSSIIHELSSLTTTCLDLADAYLDTKKIDYSEKIKDYCDDVCSPNAFIRNKEFIRQEKIIIDFLNSDKYLFTLK